MPTLTIPRRLIGLVLVFLASVASAQASLITVSGTYTAGVTTYGAGGTNAAPSITNGLGSPFTENLTLGVASAATTFINITPAGACNSTCTGWNGSTGTATDTITATFSFTSPTGATGNLSATGAYTANYANDTDSITWTSADPLVITFTDGVVLDVTLGNTSDWTLSPSITFEIVHGLPEPTSLAIFGAALAGFGLMRRRHRHQAV